MFFNEIWFLKKPVVKNTKNPSIWKIDKFCLSLYPNEANKSGYNLYFNLVSLNMKPIIYSMAVEDRKRLESIHISKHIWLINQDT